MTSIRSSASALGAIQERIMPVLCASTGPTRPPTGRPRSPVAAWTLAPALSGVLDPGITGASADASPCGMNSATVEFSQWTVCPETGLFAEGAIPRQVKGTFCKGRCLSLATDFGRLGRASKHGDHQV